MSDETKTVFVRVPKGITQSELSEISETISDGLPDEYSVIVVTDDIEFMTKDEIRQIGEMLVEAAGGPEDTEPRGLVD